MFIGTSAIRINKVTLALFYSARTCHVESDVRRSRQITCSVVCLGMRTLLDSLPISVQGFFRLLPGLNCLGSPRSRAYIELNGRIKCSLILCVFQGHGESPSLSRAQLDRIEGCLPKIASLLEIRREIRSLCRQPWKCEIVIVAFLKNYY